jgi:hypothetical protein
VSTSLVITRHQELKTSVEPSPHWESRRKGRAPCAFSYPIPAGECPSRRFFEAVFALTSFHTLLYHGAFISLSSIGGVRALLVDSKY